MSELNLSPDENEERAAQNEQNRIDYQTEATVKSGANWFYWIAGLSIINSLILLFGGNWSFIVGLGITQLVDGLSIGLSGGELGEVGTLRIIGFILDLIIAGLFVAIGTFARKLQLWAFIVGMVIYTLDAVIFIFVVDIFSLAFHALALYFIFRGFLAAKQLKTKIQ